jgi:hypothetical protein
VLFALFSEEHLLILEDNFGIDLSVAHIAKTNSMIVVNVIALVIHKEDSGLWLKV